jgi:transposase
MHKIREILRLKNELRLSLRQISKSLNIAPSTVSLCISNAKKAGLVWPINESLSDSDIYQKMYGAMKRSKSSQKSMPDFEWVYLELKKKGVTRELLWQEYCEQHINCLSYGRFCHAYREWTKKSKLSMRQTHKAGEKGFVDYSGKQFEVIEARTGEIKTAELFVFALGASGYTFAEATWTQQLPDWIHSHIRAFEYFKGCPEILVPDNLKSGVNKPHRYEPDINMTYADMATHYGCVVIPARIKKPKDKPKAEISVCLAQRWIMAKLRNRTFYSLKELNQAIKPLLEDLNNKPMQKIKKSRRALYEEIEKSELKILPSYPYQIAEFRVGRVNIDYHVEIERHYYSVPYTLVGKKVEAKITQHVIEISFNGKRITTHLKSHKKYRHTTLKEHMPESHRQYAEWTPSRLIKWGNSIGEPVGSLMKAIMENRPHPEQGFRSCLGLMRLAKAYGKERLIKACKRALVLKIYSSKNVGIILKNKLEDQPLPQEQLSLVSVSHSNIRGNLYYEGDTNHDNIS